MDEFVGQGEVCDGVGVLIAVVVVAIAAEVGSQAVVVVQHRGHAVEAQAVETELLYPVFAVGEQEMEHLGLAVVEQQRVPGGMLAACAGVEVLVVRAVEARQALGLVLDGVAVDDVKDACQP